MINSVVKGFNGSVVWFVSVWRGRVKGVHHYLCLPHYSQADPYKRTDSGHSAR